MATIFHLDLTGLTPSQAILKTSAVLENGHQDPLTASLDSEAAAATMADFLLSVGLKTQVYQRGRQWLVLGHPADSPEILVWHGPDGWQAAMDDHGRPRRTDDEPIIDLVRPISLGQPLKPAPEPSAPPVTSEPDPAAGGGGTVVLAGSRFMGNGDDALGGKLAVNFFDTLAALGQPFKIIAFYNTGVFLTTRESSIVQALRDLASRGSAVISCGVSLEHFDLKNSLKVGRIGNMYEIINAQRHAGHVIRL